MDNELKKTRVRNTLEYHLPIDETETREVFRMLEAEIKALREAMAPFEKMARALKYIDDEIVITADHLEKHAEFANYYLATRDLRGVLAALAQTEGAEE